MHATLPSDHGKLACLTKWDIQRVEPHLTLPDSQSYPMIEGTAFSYDSYRIHNDTTEVMDA